MGIPFFGYNSDAKSYLVRITSSDHHIGDSWPRPMCWAPTEREESLWNSWKAEKDSPPSSQSRNPHRNTATPSLLNFIPQICQKCKGAFRQPRIWSVPSSGKLGFVLSANCFRSPCLLFCPELLLLYCVLLCIVSTVLYLFCPELSLLMRPFVSLCRQPLGEVSPVDKGN